MQLIVTARQLSLRGEFYHQLGAMMSAGLTLPYALESLQKNPPIRSYRKPIGQMMADLEQGFTFSEAMVRSGKMLPEFDVALLQAGEQSGRLDTCFKSLAVYYQQRAQLLRQVLQGLYYPLFVVHAAIFLAPFPQVFQTGDFIAYFTQTLGILAPIYGVAFLLALACQGRHGEVWRSLVEQAGRFVPFLGKARRELALSRLSAALEALLNAGVSIIHAWELAAAASGSPGLRRAVCTWRPRIEEDGQPPSETLGESGEFPELYVNLYRTGEISGTLDDTLRRLERYYHEEGLRKMKLLSEWLPRLVYFGIMLIIARQVVSFWVNYYNGIVDAF